jgi:pimeloyl-ACP methyl ester carboxylesterase
VCENVIDKLMGGSPADHLDRYQAVSPMRLAPIGARQVLIVGVQDRSWGPVGRAYYAHAVAAGDSAVRLVEAPESGHFDIIAPPTTSWRLVVELVRTMFEQKRGRQR